MTKLSDTQRVILSHASQRDDRLAGPPERLRAAARQTVARSLIKQGLVSDEHASAYNAREAWQIDGRTRLLRITEDGLHAIGIEPKSATSVAEAELGRLTAAEYEEQALARQRSTQERSWAPMPPTWSIGRRQGARISSPMPPLRSRRPRETHWRLF